ncbi:sigma 54-interacting transcriptional regulator [Bacillus sp. 1P06AnD]|uniref:sigma 54-interacting transcriptional regulator n=1 Tax=Bacillus sp. 1P06AnD TaxID=3132208 RepID=UPI0039A00DC0
MKRKDSILQAIHQHFSYNQSFTTHELAETLQMNRANVSNDLNQLVKENRLDKTATRPVRFSLKHVPAPVTVSQENTDDKQPFLDLYYSENISLRPAIDQAKSAILYPPLGMHTLLLGETGVGKSLFAKIMHAYAIQSGRLREKAPLIVFNCADYANNPQLLLGQLFGVKKGAYTGAAEQIGLLEKADNGILFLDEVHRLTPEGQEMLFTFIDHGFFRRLGDAEVERRSNVLIICATTEDPNSALLHTFNRRIPMVITLPPLKDRTTEERFFLIQRFFSEESKRIGRNIQVSSNSMRCFLFYHCPNNIGQLKADIQLACAKAYADYITGKKADIQIFSTDLNWYIREGLFIEKKTKHHIHLYDEAYTFSYTEGLMVHVHTSSATIYDQIDQKYTELKSRGIDNTELAVLMENDIHNYFTNYLQSINKKMSKENLLKIINHDIIAISEKIILLAETTLKKTIDEKIMSGLCLHIQTLLQRIQANKSIYHPNINGIRNTHKREFNLALECIKMIEDEFNVNIPFDEVAFFTMFFIIEDKNRVTDLTKVIVLAHGNGIAKEMASVTNHLLNSNSVTGIDMPLHEGPKDFLDRVREFVRSIDPPAGILLLIDMGSLAFIGEMIEKEFKIPVRVISMASTPHVLEASRKAQIGYGLEELYNDVKNLTSFYMQTKKEQNSEKPLLKSVILTACLTGEGSAIAIKSMLESYLHYDKEMVDIIPISIYDRHELQSMLSKIARERNILCIVCNFDIEVPFLTFHLKDVLSMTATKAIQELITIEEAYIRMADTLGETLRIADGSHLVNSIRIALQDLQNDTDKFVNLESLMGIVLHISCMVDRLQQKHPLTNFANKEEHISMNYRLYIKTKQCLSSLEAHYNISIPDDEICYIMDIFLKNDEIVPLKEA